MTELCQLLRCVLAGLLLSLAWPARAEACSRQREVRLGAAVREPARVLGGLRRWLKARQIRFEDKAGRLRVTLPWHTYRTFLARYEAILDDVGAGGRHRRARESFPADCRRVATGPPERVRVTVRLRRPKRSPEAMPRSRSLPFPWLRKLGAQRLRNPPRARRRRRGRPSAGLRSYLDGFLGLQHRLTDDTYRDDRESGAVLGALELRALADEALLGLDLAFGGGFDGGFAYRSAGYLGLAVSPLSGVFLLGAGGLGIDGLTGVVPPALLLPLEGRLAVDAFETRVQLVGRIAAAPTSRQRRGGTFRFPFADEASLGLHVTTPEVEVLDSNLRFGVSLGEQLGANLWTISVGVGGMLADRL